MSNKPQKYLKLWIKWKSTSSTSATGVTQIRNNYTGSAYGKSYLYALTRLLRYIQKNEANMWQYRIYQYPEDKIIKEWKEQEPTSLEA